MQFKTFDFEVFRNFVCVDFYDGKEHRTFEYPLSDIDKNWINQNVGNHHSPVIGFNSKNYDDLMLAMLLNDFSPLRMHQASVSIIDSHAKVWNLANQYGLNINFGNIDIMPILPGKAGLKLYGARVHHKNLVELPVDPYKDLTKEEINAVREYVKVDTEVTYRLAMLNVQELALRQNMSRTYNLDLMSKSGPQIAEAVLVSEFEKRSGYHAQVPDLPSMDKLIRFDKPAWIKFETPEYQKLLSDIENDTFVLDEVTGHLELGRSVKARVFKLKQCSVKMGIGGLHSIDSAGHIAANDGRALYDIDVASMYPSMIINAGWYPSHMGPDFLDVYSHIVNTRLAAKNEGNKIVANSLKLVVNSSFGQFSNPYSKLYSPNLLLNTTISGQLTLLMLIEKLETNGLNVVSVNTDGIVVNPNLEQTGAMGALVSEFENETGLSMEYTQYKMYARQSVNNYFAITTDGKVKGKGIFQVGYNDTSHNPTANVIAKAVIEYFDKGTPIKNTIESEDMDVRDFLVVRTVKGGAVKNGELIGKIIRWYYSSGDDTAIHYASNGNKVPNSDKGAPYMNHQNKIPMDLDKGEYQNQAEAIVEEMSVALNPYMNILAAELVDNGFHPVPAGHNGVTIMRDGHDFSSCENLDIQTGYRAGIIAVECAKENLDKFQGLTMSNGKYMFFKFTNPLFPGSMVKLSKKLGYSVVYGGSLPYTDTQIMPAAELPDDLWYDIFHAMTNPQKVKAAGGHPCLKGVL